MKHRTDMTPAERATYETIDRLHDRHLYEEVRRIARDHFVTVEDLVGHVKRKKLVAARHATWRHLHDGVGMSWTEIAEVFGRKHDSVSHAKRPALRGSNADLIKRWVLAEAATVQGHLDEGRAPNNLIAEVQVAAFEHVAAGIERGLWRDTRPR